MQKQAQFFILSETSEQAEQSDLSPAEDFACEQAGKLWRAGKRVLIYCAHEQQAFAIDEALWARDAEQFVPHNLSGEITQFATPVEIAWGNKRNAQRRDVIINLQSQLPDFISSFNQLIDFVPTDEQQKAQARERYKQLRQMGWELKTEQV